MKNTIIEFESREEKTCLMSFVIKIHRSVCTSAQYDQYLVVRCLDCVIL